jgi:hypothetical protein
MTAQSRSALANSTMRARLFRLRQERDGEE